jgi:hypothetical protein
MFKHAGWMSWIGCVYLKPRTKLCVAHSLIVHAALAAIITCTFCPPGMDPCVCIKLVTSVHFVTYSSERPKMHKQVSFLYDRRTPISTFSWLKLKGVCAKCPGLECLFSDGNFLLLRPYHGEHGPKVPVTRENIVLQRVLRNGNVSQS